jgi:hypothetical protein
MRVAVDTSKFNAMVREIARKAGVPNEEVLTHEVGKILEKTITNTKAATVSSIRATSEKSQFSMQPESLYSPKGGRAGVNVTKNGFIAYFLRNRYPDNLWALMSARRKVSLAAKLKARGLARKSWLDIANRLGLSINYPGYVASAVPSSGKEHPENTRVRLARQNGKLQIAFQNSQPTVNRIGGSRALQAAIDGRYKFFITQMAKGTFDDIAKIAKKYPGIRIL